MPADLMTQAVLWLKEHGKAPGIWWLVTTCCWGAAVGVYIAEDSLVGRALALAALRAYGVEVSK